MDPERRLGVPEGTRLKRWACRQAEGAPSTCRRVTSAASRRCHQSPANPARCLALSGSTGSGSRGKVCSPWAAGWVSRGGLVLPAIPVDALILRNPGAWFELGADGVGDWDERHLHDLLVRDAEDGGSVLLVGQVEACPRGA